jgi:hypothetical protein
MLKIVYLALAAAFLGVCNVSVAAADDKPVLTYWHLWTDKQGMSHLTHCSMSSFTLLSMNKPAEPQWQDRQPGKANVIFTVQPPNWKGTWHEDPRVQWVVPLNGSWFVEAQDGTRAEMGPGDVFLGEDLGTKPDARGYKGHLSGNVSSGPVTLMVVQLDTEPTVDQPCHVK